MTHVNYLNFLGIKDGVEMILITIILRKSKKSKKSVIVKNIAIKLTSFLYEKIQITEN